MLLIRLSELVWKILTWNINLPLYFFNKKISILGAISPRCRKGGAFNSVFTSTAAGSLLQAHSHWVRCIWSSVSLETSLCRAKGITSSFPVAISHLEIWEEFLTGLPHLSWTLLRLRFALSWEELYVIGSAQILQSCVVWEDSKPLWKGLTASVHHRKVALEIKEIS